MNESLFSRFVGRVFGSEISRRVSLAVRALDDGHDRPAGNSDSPRDRLTYKREEILRLCLEAWKDNPLARRIVELTSDYVVGGGLSVASDHPATHDFLDQWWNHRLNHLSTRAFEWCDEMTRSGELFIAVSTDQSGMSYVRAIPALEILDILTAPNDIEQEQTIVQKAPSIGDDPIAWPVYDHTADFDGTAPVMVHYCINRPVGAKHGESDLAPILKWLTRYSAWLEDRARLNRFRQSFLYVVKGVFASEQDRAARERQLNANPPNPGSILVSGDGESWEAINPQLHSIEAGQDGESLKKMIAVGAGVPMHFLAEPEGSTRTTAEQSGGPTFRHYDRRQLYFRWLMTDLAAIAARRRALVDSKVSGDSAIAITGTDISVRDNASLAAAGVAVVNAFARLRDREVIDDFELVRMAYKFAGEVVDVDALLKAGKKAGPPKVMDAGSAGGTSEGAPDLKLDPETGDVNVKEPS